MRAFLLMEYIFVIYLLFIKNYYFKIFLNNLC
nr:MAG TPA: hypothetical protein [Caudoviricetes sp.]DAU56623.1 MAG TPA: hypothetical protein [Caudoviricetes sp.]